MTAARQWSVVNIKINKQKYLTRQHFSSNFQELIWYEVSAGSQGVRNIRFNPEELWEMSGRDWWNNYIAQKIIRCQSFSWSNKDVTASPECGVISVLIAISNQRARVPLTSHLNRNKLYIFSSWKTNIWFSSNPFLSLCFVLTLTAY